MPLLFSRALKFISKMKPTASSTLPSNPFNQNIQARFFSVARLFKTAPAPISNSNGQRNKKFPTKFSMFSLAGIGIYMYTQSFHKKEECTKYTILEKDVIEKANFSVFFPDRLPKDLTLKEVSFRPENWDGSYPRSSLKLSFEDDNSHRKLSIKQFNYDWAPAAYDCPSLWKNHQNFNHLDTPAPRPFLVDYNILWIGTNYRNQSAASIIKDRTTIEFVITEGEFSDAELIDIAKQLTPLNQEQHKHILSKNMAELSYGYPKTVASVNVPISFWSFPVENSQVKFQTAYKKNEVPATALAAHIPLAANSPYKLEAVFAYHVKDKPDKNTRYNFVYEHATHKGNTIQILQMANDSSSVCTFPPKPDNTQKFITELRKVGEFDCYYAYRSEIYGPHELIFQYKGNTYLVLAKPSSFTSKDWFFDLMNHYLSSENLSYTSSYSKSKIKSP